MSDCPFCEKKKEEYFQHCGHFFAAFDFFPVSRGHLLIIPYRHIPGISDLSADEEKELMPFIRYCKDRLNDEFKPDGFNLGINEGHAAGQTIPHLHIHLIPRYKGDVAEPEGGVRGVIPDKKKYRHLMK